MQVQFEYQLTTMPTACFDAAVRQHRRLPVPNLINHDLDVLFYMDADDFADALEVRSNMDEHGRYRDLKRYIRVPVQLVEHPDHYAELEYNLRCERDILWEIQPDDDDSAYHARMAWLDNAIIDASAHFAREQLS